LMSGVRPVDLEGSRGRLPGLNPPKSTQTFPKNLMFTPHLIETEPDTQLKC